ncbi:hypothetical protein TNCV_4720741 [Trichonephila clavipes]|uniref:Uncharacterized protein n=1 Tax=Trichonephila clavipes TaxID=2585209 RepID=A0A8X6W765_TRICX|nr:hypothetical protein TNCV_4720741 [Trichonephila clavipes]
MTPGVSPVCLGTDSLMAGVPLSSFCTTITGTKAEPAFLPKYNRSPFRPPMSSGLTPLASQMAMARRLWNTHNRVPGSELSLK